MKGLTHYVGRKIGQGWQARTQWKGKLSRKRFASSSWGGDRKARGAAVDWLLDANIAMGKRQTNRWIRSSGGWGRAGKRGKWKR